MTSTRRDFLKTSLGAATLVSLGPTIPTFFSATALADAAGRNSGETVLIVLQLAGGNDGLNAVVPFADDHYARNRDTLRLKAGEVHKLDSLLGLHPRMEAFWRLFQDGRLGIVQGVGYPNPDGDHFRAMRNWQSARPHQIACQTGWLGRAADWAAQSNPSRTPAAYVGQIPRPFTLNAQQTVVPTVASVDAYALRWRGEPQDAGALEQSLASTAQASRSESDNPLAGYLQKTTLSAYAARRRMEEVAAGRTASRPGDYPSIELAGSLRTIAQLIRADLGIRVFYTELGGPEPGGFDNHANQRDNHAALLHQLSESVAAFLHDLDRDKLADRVLLMTFSEFGRTLAENGRRGTGHGSAAPMFLVGGRVAGGLVGPHPRLDVLQNEGPPFHTDFRRVYATLLDRWLGFDSRAILGEPFAAMDLLRS